MYFATCESTYQEWPRYKYIIYVCHMYNNTGEGDSMYLRVDNKRLVQIDTLT